MNEPIEPVCFTCDWCGQEFPADPETMVATQFITDLTAHSPPELWADMMEEMGLSEEQLDKLLATGMAENGYECVCMECQAEDEEDDFFGEF